MLPDASDPLEAVFQLYSSWLLGEDPDAQEALRTSILLEMSWLAASLCDPKTGSIDPLGVRAEFERRFKQRGPVQLKPTSDEQDKRFWMLVDDCARRIPIHTRTRLLWRWKALGDSEAEEGFLQRVEADLRQILQAALARRGVLGQFDRGEFLGDFWLRVSRYTPPEIWRNSARFFGWTKTVIENILLDHLRQRKRLGEVEEAAPVSDANSDLGHVIGEYLIFCQELDRHFPPEKQYGQIAYLSLLGLDTEEISLHTRLSVTTVNRRRSVVREMLRIRPR